jgi:hypothetical protein
MVGAHRVPVASTLQACQGMIGACVSVLVPSSACLLQPLHMAKGQPACTSSLSLSLGGRADLPKDAPLAERSPRSHGRELPLPHAPIRHPLPA